MVPEKVEKILGYLPDFRKQEGKTYYPQVVILNSDGDRKTAGCKYSEENDPGGDGKKFLLFVSRFEETGGAQRVFKNSESFQIDGEEVSEYFPNFSSAKELVLKEGKPYFSWLEEDRIYTLIGLGEEVDGDDLREIFKNLSRNEDGGLDFPFLRFKKYIPQGIGDWKLKAIFIFREEHRTRNHTFVFPGIKSKYLKGDEYLNLQYIFPFSFFPESVSEGLRPPKGRRTKEINSREVCVGDGRLIHWNDSEKFSIKVLCPEKSDDVSMEEMQRFMEKAIQATESYSSHGDSMKFVSEVRKMGKN